MMHEQRSLGWYSNRVGKVTASRVADIVAGTKDRLGVYMLNLAAERLTGTREEIYVNKAMQRGIDTEEVAKSVFMFETGIEVFDTGFWEDKEIIGFGASPDGLTDDGGLIEIKCPNTNTHLKYLKDKKLPDQYKPQVQAQLSVTGLPFGYFMSFDNRLPENMQSFMVRVERDEEYIKVMREKVQRFLNDLEDLIDTLSKENIKWQQVITNQS